MFPIVYRIKDFRHQALKDDDPTLITEEMEALFTYQPSEHTADKSGFRREGPSRTHHPA